MAERITDLDTPALLLDADVFEKNLQTAAAFVADKPARLRPHFKNHKCVTLAKRQLAAGNAVGITAAKLAEAEMLVAGGVNNVLIANQIAGPTKAKRLVELSRRATVRVAIDSLDHALAISAVADPSHPIGVLIEVDIGMKRCGVEPGSPVVDLARRLVDLPGVRFDGLQAYEGHAIGIRDRRERTREVERSMGLATATRKQLEESGIPVAIVSGAGTSTYRISGSMPGVDELQIGSYATMDWYYHQLTGDEFGIAMSILASVISTHPDRFVLDIGVKGVGDEMGPPKLRDYPNYVVERFSSEEHCVVTAPGHSLRVGDKVHVIPSHCCTTSNLHRHFVLHSKEQVLDRWPIEAAGALS